MDPTIGAPKKIMPLCRVSTISIMLLTYLFVSPFLFRCDGLAWRVSSRLSGKAATASGCSSSSGSVRKSIEDGSYNVREVVLH